MPYTVDSARYPVSQPLPEHLGHKPFYAIPYEHFDGIYANNTDTIYLSIGTAQYDANQISVKAMRYVGSQWSPQAEELPVHRVIDMTILVAKALFDSANGTFTLPGGVLYNQMNCISISQEQRTSAEVAVLNAFINQNGQLLRDRLNALADVLNNLRRRGQI